MGFDIMSLQKGRGMVQARSKADEGRTVLKYIDVDDLVPSDDNFYSMSAIDELATLIELSGGVKQPALVVPMGGGKYKVIAGHRRRLASLQLVKQGKEAYWKMPCMVDTDEREPGADADELRAIDEAILLITTKGQREKTDWDKVQEATRLRDSRENNRRYRTWTRKTASRPWTTCGKHTRRWLTKSSKRRQRKRRRPRPTPSGCASRTSRKWPCPAARRWRRKPSSPNP